MLVSGEEPNPTQVDDTFPSITAESIPTQINFDPPRLTATPPPVATARSTASVIPAFSGAEGAGAETAGGRGGQVIEVTSLNDSGPGSLRAAIDTKGPRIVVFRVGGVIELKKPLRITEPYITIAGHTAPGGGITLRGTDNNDGEMIIIRDVHDVVIRYLRIRSAARGEPGRGQSNIAIDSGAYNIIIDHCSLSWSLDENIMIHRNIPPDADAGSWPEIYNITIQRSIIAEGFYPHSTGIQLGGEADVDGWRGVHDITLHHNLFVNNSHRNPGVGSLNTQVINNVVYNWSPQVGSTWRDVNVDWIGNYFKPGPMSNPKRVLVHAAFPVNRPDQPWPAPSLYTAGNVAPPYYPDPEEDNWQLYSIHYLGIPLPEEFRRHQPLPDPAVPVTVQSAFDAYNSVLFDSGANARLFCDGSWIFNPDAVDQRLLNQVREGSGPSRRPVADENEVGGFPSIEQGTACDDRDRDGMPDVWELAHALNPDLDDSAEYDLDPDITNIEVYLNG